MPLSQKQMEYLALAWQCFENEPKIDYDKFKEVAGLASAHSARELMRVTKNKLKTEYGSLSGGIQASNAATVNGTPKKQQLKSSSTTSTPGSRKRAAPGSGAGTGRKKQRTNGMVNGEGVNGAEEDDDAENVTPTKKVKKSKTGSESDEETKVKAEVEVEESYEMF